jgi:hypothetical protein
MGVVSFPDVCSQESRGGDTWGSPLLPSQAQEVEIAQNVYPVRKMERDIHPIKDFRPAYIIPGDENAARRSLVLSLRIREWEGECPHEPGEGRFCGKDNHLTEVFFAVSVSPRGIISYPTGSLRLCGKNWGMDGVSPRWKVKAKRPKPERSCSEPVE